MIGFKDIVGYEKEKEELMFICDVIKNSSKYKESDVFIPKTLLLYGDPGTGKTTMCKALINESGRKCFHCKKNKSDGDFINEIRETFEEAKKNSPSIIFLDDMDKFAEDNLQMDSNKEEFAAIQACMEDLEGEDVFILATANDITYLPDSLLRTGRFGRKMEIKMPDIDSVNLLMKQFLDSNNIECEMSSYDLSFVLYGNSFATIKEIINEAKILSIYNKHKTITNEDLTSSILKNIFKEISNEKCTTSEIVRAIHEAGHTAMAVLKNRTVSFTTIVSHGCSGGLTRVHDLDKSNGGLNELKVDLLIALAGKAAVEIDKGVVDLGTEKDIEDATEKLSHALRKQLGYGFNYGYYLDRYNRRQSRARCDLVVSKVYEILEETYKEALSLLRENIGLLHLLEDELLLKKTLLYSDIYAIAMDYYSKESHKDYDGIVKTDKKVINTSANV